MNNETPETHNVSHATHLSTTLDPKAIFYKKNMPWKFQLHSFIFENARQIHCALRIPVRLTTATISTTTTNTSISISY